MADVTHKLPPWLEGSAAQPEYAWALTAWRKATAVEGAWFDHAKADAVVKAWPTIFRLTDDRFRGVPFKLLLWQEITVRLLVGWKKPIEIIDPATHKSTIAHVRLFRRLDLWIPRKNGKTEFLAALGVLFFVLERVPGGQAFVFGRNKDQGKVPFRKMQAMITEGNGIREDRAGNERVLLSKEAIFVRETGALCELLTGKPDGKHGRSPNVIVGDEIHEWQTRELADTLRQGTGARLQPIQLYASTAGRKSGRVGWEWYQESLAIMSGEKDDPTTLVVHFAIGEEDDWQDEAVWRKANPSLGLTPTLDYLRGEFREAKGKPAKEAVFQCYHLNRWVDQVGGWLPVSKWSACASDADGWMTAEARFRGRKAYGACDVSSTRDITALVWLFPPESEGDPWSLLPFFWVPEGTLEERAIEDRRVNWRGWINQKALFATPGDSVDQNFVGNAIRRGFGQFDVQGFGFDPWNAQKLMTDLEEDGLDMTLVQKMRQGTATLGEATKEFERLVFAGQLDHGGHPVLGWMAKHCQVRFDDNLNYVPAKKQSIDKIDGIVASVMATALAINGTEADDLDGFTSNPVMVI
ncbi:terminase [Aureimonas ureilytica]|uniref:Terminase n=1 Tax=Aureimonas ureilytica TaxID=401562 RepID=A0A175RV47_9HYPH|nr:terminase TerL endonuclease subunit [Aureimonas ureilytica]KTR07341.1 terminase [Aureimonas ureilytica]